MDSKLFEPLSDEDAEQVVGGAGRGGNPGFGAPWPALGEDGQGFILTHNYNADNGDNGAQNIQVGVPGDGSSPGA